MNPPTPLLTLYRVLAAVGTFIVVISFLGSIGLLFYWGNVFPPIALVGIGVFMVILGIATVVSMVIINKSYHNESLLQRKYINDEYMASLLDSSAMYIIRTDAQGNYTYANRSFLETFVEPEDRKNLVGIGSMKYILPEDHILTFQAIEQCYRQPETPVSVRLRKPALNGAVLVTEWEFKAIVGEDGSIQEFQCTGVDITERQRLYEKVEKERSTLDNLVASINGIVWEADMVLLRLTYISPSTERILGYSQKEWFEDPIFWENHLYPDDSNSILQLSMDATSQLQNYELEYRFVKANGEVVWLRDIVTVESREGELYRLKGIMVDITEQKKARKAIKKSEENLKIAQRLAKIGSWEWDIASNSVTWSEEQYHLFGETPEIFQTTYEGYLNHLSTEEQVRTKNLVSEALEGKAPYHIEHEITRRDGTTFFAMEHGEVVCNESGAPIRMYGTTQDITERKRTEEHIRRSEANFRAIFDASVQSHFLIDSSYRIQLWNKNAAKQARQVFEREIRLGDDMRHFILQDHGGTFEQNFQLALQGISSRFEKAVQLPFETFARWYEYQYTPVRDSIGEIISVSLSALDITEQKNASEQLAQSEQRYRSFVELQGTYFVRTDLAGNYTYASPSMLKGYSPQGASFMGKNGLEHIIPEDHDIVRNTIERCLQVPNTPVQVILRKPHVSGRIFTTDWEFIAVTNSEGIPTEIQCVGYDITDRVQAETLLAASEEKYRSMVHNIADIITLLDAEGNILYESSSIRTILGWSETDLVGKSIFEYLHPDDIALIQERFGSVLLHEIVENTEFRFRHKNGQYILLEGLASNQLDNPAIRAIIVNSRDITERKAMLSKLTEYSQELQHIIDSMLDGLLLLDDQQRIVMINPAVVDMFGYAEEELATMPLSALMPERFRDKHQGYVEGFVRIPFQRMRIQTALGQTSSGVEFPIDVSLASFMIHDKRMTLAIVRDITEQQQAHEEIMQLNKTLESRVEERTHELMVLNNEKNEFMGIASHDLKNPLASIISSGQILERYFATDDSIKRFTAVIIDASNQMLDIITNLLDVNKIESGKVHLKVQPMNLLDVLDILVEEYQMQASNKGIILHYQADATWVYVDVQALRQILDNLISNAIKYSPHWKNVWVRVMPRTDEAGQRFGRVEVQDEGPGFSADDHSKLFTKFARLSAQPTGGEHSTGLGLSIVKKLVEMHQGRVWCESVLGQGATFILELPSVEAPSVEAPSVEAPKTEEVA